MWYLNEAAGQLQLVTTLRGEHGNSSKVTFRQRIVTEGNTHRYTEKQWKRLWSKTDAAKQ